jgi:hypothetical protein
MVFNSRPASNDENADCYFGRYGDLVITETGMGLDMVQQVRAAKQEVTVSSK